MNSKSHEKQLNDVTETQIEELKEKVAGLSLETVELKNAVEHWKSRAMDAEKLNRGK